MNRQTLHLNIISIKALCLLASVDTNLRNFWPKHNHLLTPLKHHIRPDRENKSTE